MTPGRNSWRSAPPAVPPAQRAGVELLAFGGRFIEIGKKDIYGDTRMGLFPFRRNLSFYGVDLALMRGETLGCGLRGSRSCAFPTTSC